MSPKSDSQARGKAQGQRNPEGQVLADLRETLYPKAEARAELDAPVTEQALEGLQAAIRHISDLVSQGKVGSR